MTKDLIWYDYNAQKRQTYRDRKHISGCLGLDRRKLEGKMGSDYWKGLTFWDDENVLILIMITVIQFCEYFKNHWIAYFKCVNCMMCELYPQKALTKEINKDNLQSLGARNSHYREEKHLQLFYNTGKEE